MTTQLQTTLNVAQASIYSRSNIRRAFTDFDDADVASIAVRDDKCIVTYKDGAEVCYPIDPIKTAFGQFTYRLKDFFSYLGPNYRGPTIWRNNAYIIYKGWNYGHALGHLTSSAQLQKHWADKFIHLSNPQKLLTLLQSDQTDLGHLVAPDGLRYPNPSVDMESDLEEEESGVPPVNPEPYCSCGSFQRQLLNVSEFQREITGFKPWCIHLTWFHKYRELLVKRADVRNESRGGSSKKCVAWWYAPPADHTPDGRFVLLHTTHGAMAPLTHWRTYKPKEIFTQHHAWDLFFNMIDAGYIPFPGSSLPQLSTFFKNHELGKQTSL
jgi:hypothetical protein